MNVVLYYTYIGEYTDSIVLCTGHTDEHKCTSLQQVQSPYSRSGLAGRKVYHSLIQGEHKVFP